MIYNLALLLALILSAYGVYGVYAQPQQQPRQPFRVLVKQSEPPVTLFVHQPTGECFLAYEPGGLLRVAASLCKEQPILPPIGPPISPERE